MSNVFHEEVTQGDESSAGTASASDVGSLPTDKIPPECEKGTDAVHECRSMASRLGHGDVPTPVAKNENVQSEILSKANKEIKKKKMPDNTHGLRFELKLLSLFCVRGLGAGYKFELSKEKEDEGGKLEDLIFRYQVPDKTLEGKHWRYRYLQAKHKENEGEKITADHLLDYNHKGDFNLTKYFHSFYKIIARGDDIHDCIICTNIGLNENSLKEVGIELVPINNQSEDILKFDAPEKTARYKLKINNNNWHRRLKEEWSPVQLLAKEIKDCATNNKTTQIRTGMLNSYHVALVEENVIDCTAKKFHQDFVSDAGSLSEAARELRQTLCALGENDDWKNWKFKLSNNFGKGQSAVKNPLPGKITEEDVDNFFDKLVFVVDMPSEEKFEEIIETRDMIKYYQPDKCKAQTIRIVHEVSKEFSNQEQNFWLKAEKAKNILLADVTKMSLEYQSQLEKEIKFNDDVIKIMVFQLRQKLLESDGRKKVEQIATLSPKHTAVKVISAVQILMRELKQEGNYLVASSSRLQNEEERKRWTNILKLPKGLCNFFVVVCDAEASISSYENLITDGDHADVNNFILIVSRDGPVAGIIDEIKYTDLSKDFQENFLTTTISFQGKILTVGDLVGEKPEEVIDFSSLNELLFGKTKQVKIPSYDTSRFEESLYINRRVKTPFDNHFEDELAKRLGVTSAELGKECRISPGGHIEWLVEEKRQKEIWDKMKNGADKTTPSGIIAEDNQLISFEMERRSIVIISGVAGTGKSTLLSHFYKEIKTKKPDYWVIKMNLVDRCEAIMKWYDGKQTNAADFFVNYLHEIGNNDSSFTNSLLRHRLEKGDRIAIMLDGFDEIDAKCQMGAIQLMKAISKNKSIQLYVTTRPHSVGDLQNELFQFSYTLEIFDMNDQIKYLTQYWETKLDTEEDIQDKSIIRKFAASLTNRVSQTLRDQERSFIGIPLQCRILAECFQQELKTIIKPNNGQDGLEEQTDFENQLFANVNFDLNSLYERLMETKRRVFREEKAKEKASDPNEVIAFAIDFLMKKIESHLTKLAIETLVTDKKSADTLWPLQSSYHQSETEKTQEEKNITKFGVKFGLITFKEKRDEEMKPQFLHRTFAEYLFARYLYQGFLLDEKRHNKLLENESIRMLILKEILARREYDGVQVFFNSMLKELVGGDKEWRNRIDRRNLPERIKKLTVNFYDQFLPEESPPMYSDYALLFSLFAFRKKTTTFTFLCDCLDATFDKETIQIIMTISFREERKYYDNLDVRSQPNDLVNSHVQCDHFSLENHLRKLAIKTIAKDERIVNVLLDRLPRLGLKRPNKKSLKIQFLPRTFAEYLFARYLYQGFLLDEYRCNKMLNFKSVRMLILKKILSTWEYDGVQVFFNNMLKELVEDDKWRYIIDNRELPERLKNFTKNFYNRFLCRELLPQVTAIQRYDCENALHFSLSTGKTTIFTLLCDCLDATLDKKQIENVMMKSFMDKTSSFSFKFFRQIESKYFKRFIDYLDSEAGEVMSMLTANPYCLPPCGLEYSQWNGEEQKKTVHILLQFMSNQREAFDNYFIPNREITTERMLTFFIFNENYESHLKIFLGLLSRSTVYSDDYYFENLLKKAFCSKEHFIGGRIEKVLITLFELNRQNLLTQLFGIVLTIEPESFRNIYQPPPIEGDAVGKDVELIDLNILTERDSYRMTRLHRAAFHGNTEEVEKMLERIRQNLNDPEQKGVADQVINEVVARDQYGFTPFYVAAVRDQEEIYHKMLVFLKQVLPDKILETNSTDSEGFVHRGLSDSIDSENIQMFQLILRAAKKVLGQKDLIRVLRFQNVDDQNEDLKSFFVKCKTKELFNAMAKIVGTRDDNAPDYTDLYDLVFHNNTTIQSLEYIDVENLQELLSLRGVDDFTRRIQDNIGFNTGFSLLSNHLLEHFKKYQLEQFVATVISKNNLRKIEESRETLKFVALDDSNKELISRSFRFSSPVEFHDNDDGTTPISIISKEQLVPRNSYWRDFILSAASFNFYHDGDEDVLRIFDCLKRVNDSFLKKLLLHEEYEGFIMIQLSLEVVQRMLTYLSKESQEDVKQQWKDNAPSMDTFFPLTMEQPNNDDTMSTARRWTNILRFYLHYGIEDHLKEFVNIVTSLRNIGVERRSVWSYIFEHCHKEDKTKEILKLVSEKSDILGSDALKTILLHKIDEIPLLIKALLWGLDIDAWLEILPKEIREEIQQFMTINAPGLIDEAFQKPQTHFKIFDSEHHYKRLNTLISFLSYSNDIQLQQFVQNLTLFNLIIPINGPLQQEKKCSIWAELLTHACHDRNTADIAKMDKFMKCLSEKLGSNAVKKLVLHNDGERPVIFYPALRGDEKLMEKMLKYLSVENREKVEYKVDKFLETTCKTDVSP